MPQLKKGFFATLEHPINVFKCGTESHCPGGQPNSCAEGRQVRGPGPGQTKRWGDGPAPNLEVPSATNDWI